MRRSSESRISVILRPSQHVLMSMFFIPSRSAPENLSEKISLSLTISPVQHWLYFIRSTFLSQRLSAFAGITNARCLIKLKIHFFTFFSLKCKLLHFRESVSLFSSSMYSLNYFRNELIVGKELVNRWVYELTGIAQRKGIMLHQERWDNSSLSVRQRAKVW